MVNVDAINSGMIELLDQRHHRMIGAS